MITIGVWELPVNDTAGIIAVMASFGLYPVAASSIAWWKGATVGAYKRRFRRLWYGNSPRAMFALILEHVIYEQRKRICEIVVAFRTETNQLPY